MMQLCLDVVVQNPATRQGLPAKESPSRENASHRFTPDPLDSRVVCHARVTTIAEWHVYSGVLAQAGRART